MFNKIVLPLKSVEGIKIACNTNNLGYRWDYRASERTKIYQRYRLIQKADADIQC